MWCTVLHVYSVISPVTHTSFTAFLDNLIKTGCTSSSEYSGGSDASDVVDFFCCCCCWLLLLLLLLTAFLLLLVSSSHGRSGRGSIQLHKNIETGVNFVLKGVRSPRRSPQRIESSSSPLSRTKERVWFALNCPIELFLRNPIIKYVQFCGSLGLPHQLLNGPWYNYSSFIFVMGLV